MTFDLAQIRDQFPALTQETIFLDNPAGTQITRRAVDRVSEYLIKTNANHGAGFATSRASDAVVDEARLAAADFLNASRPEEIVFGPNMTSLTFNISRSLAHWLEPGEEIVVTRLDHDGNITPWTIIAEERGCHVRWVDFHPEDGTLDMDEMHAAIEKGPKLVAVGYASNALGTINPVKEIVKMAHGAGALVYIDAVQYAPHGPIDVKDLDPDFLVCSAYKFFSTHVGILYGKFKLLNELTAYRLRPAPADPPGKFETGTGNFEGYAGVLGALEYLEWLGETYGTHYAEKYEGKFSGRRLRLKQSMAAIRAYEYELSHALLEVLEETPSVTIHGPTDVRRLEERVPTVSFTLKGRHPRWVARMLDRSNINVWNGNYYALAVTERLGLEESGGMVRVGPVHYNTVEEIERFGKALERIAAE
jgi:cysteine desulfurase family protein (TIGR01976 family)